MTPPESLPPLPTAVIGLPWRMNDADGSVVTYCYTPRQMREYAAAAVEAALSSRPVADSIHADNARTLRAVIDELRDMLGLDEGESLKAAVQALSSRQVQHAQAEAVEPAAPVAGPDLWWVCFEDDANTGAVWTRQPGSDDLAWLSKETGRPNVTFRLVLERAQACKPVGHWSDNPPARQCSECSITHDVGECDQPATQAPTAVPEDVRRDAWASAANWLRNNYQDHPNIASLCDAMREYGAKGPQ